MAERLLLMVRVAERRPLMLRAALISDLFFNYEHPLYNATVEDREPHEGDIEQAVYEEATEFFEQYQDLLTSYVPELTLSPEYFRDDFLNRL